MSDLTITIEENVKNEAEKLYDRLGLSLSMAVRMFLMQSIREQAIPFQVKMTEDEKYYDYFNSYNIERLRKSEEQAKNGQIIYKTLAELEAMTSE